MKIIFHLSTGYKFTLSRANDYKTVLDYSRSRFPFYMSILIWIVRRLSYKGKHIVKVTKALRGYHQYLPQGRRIIYFPLRLDKKEQREIQHGSLVIHASSLSSRLISHSLRDPLRQLIKHFPTASIFILFYYSCLNLNEPIYTQFLFYWPQSLLALINSIEFELLKNSSGD